MFCDGALEMILYNEGATKAQEDFAEEILTTLCDVYPGYPWAVRVYEGGFFIRHLGYPPGWGMNCKHPSFGHSSFALKRQIIRHAGEWLERAKLKRGRANDDEPEYVEGIPDKYQLPSEKPAVFFEHIVADSHRDPLGGND
ncbi:MAG: hypothetical protein V1685_07045, partial [Parcubacteria group bacterium]